MFQLARNLTKQNGSSPVIVTATSHMGIWQFSLADRHIMTDTPEPLEELEHGLQGVILVTGEMEGERSKPVNAKMLKWLHDFCAYHAIPLLIEADGSRQKPLKAWTENEPPVPEFVREVIQIAGFDGIGKPLTDENIHRAKIFSQLSEIEIGETVTTQALIHVLTHQQGGLKNIPATAHKTVILNQADTLERQSMAYGMVEELLSTFERVIISSLQQENIWAVHEHIAGVILAAGESKRYGEIKQLLDWHGMPFVRSIAMTAMDAGLSPVIVITGAKAEKVETVVKDLGIRVVHNPKWESGQGSSIKAGISSLTGSNSGGAIFLLADQPQVTPSVLRALVQKHAEDLYPIVAPMVLEQRANPVLFDRSTFDDLLSIEGDVGGRAIFHRHRVEYLPWHDDRLLLDVDTPEMYQRLISDETL